MNRMNKGVIIGLLLLLSAGLGFARPAAAARQLQVGSDTVTNTGSEAERTADLDIILKGGFDDVNGLAFTLLYDSEVFEFVGLVQKTMTLDDGSSYNPGDPAPEGVATTLFYQANDLPGQNRVVIAAASADFLTDDTADFIPFTARFMVKTGQGNGSYPIQAQRTIIGPDPDDPNNTAENAGYTVPTLIPVATGLAPDADPSTATNYPVQLLVGNISVGGGYAVTGTVQYAPATDAAGVTVNLFKQFNSEFYLNGSTTTNADGDFTLTGKPNGTYKILVLAKNPGFQRRFLSDAFTIAGAPQDMGTITLAAYAPLTGNITVNGAVVPGVKARVMSGQTVIGVYPVDANGNFVSAPVDPNGTYTVTAVYGSAQSEVESDVNGNYLLDWDLGLGSLAGTVGGLAAGQHAMVHLISPDAQLEKYIRLTGNGGPMAYQFNNLLPAADYLVSIVGDGFAVIYYDNVTDIDEASLRTVVADQTTQKVDFTIAAPVDTITGSILQGGSGLPGVPVFGYDTASRGLTSTFSGAGGNYTLNVAQGSDNIVFAYKTNGKVFFYDADVQNTTTQILNEADPVAAGSSGINLNLDEDLCSIKGRVTFQRNDGPPAPGVLILAQGPRGNGLGVTDASGDYRIDGLYCGDGHRVTMFPAPPFTPQRVNNIVPTESGTVQDFIINTGWTLAGTVVDGDNDNAPIAGAWVMLLDDTGHQAGVPVITGDNGAFSFADIEGGVYILHVLHADYLPETVADLEIQTNVSDLQVVMTQGATISGTVYDQQDPDPLPGARMLAVTPGEPIRQAVTGDTGAYAFNGLTTGRTYNVAANKPGYIRQVRSTVAPDGTLDFTLLQPPPDRWDLDGTIKVNDTPVDGARVVVSSVANNFFASTTTADGGLFSFTDLIEANDYRILVSVPGRPVYSEMLGGDGVLDQDVAGYSINIQSATISGTITLDPAQAGLTVQVYLLDAATGLYVDDTGAVDNGDGTYDYTFADAETGRNLKVLAFAPDYTAAWYGGTGFGDADTVQAGDPGVDFTMNGSP